MSETVPTAVLPRKWRTERDGEPGTCGRCGKVVKDLDAHWRGPCPKTAKARCGFCPNWRPWFEQLYEAENALRDHNKRRTPSMHGDWVTG